jgi:hypothetical protein
MATYSKELLSESPSGRLINITATGAEVQTIHTTPASSGSLDEVWLYATNPTTSDQTLNLLYGGSGINNDILFKGVIEAYAGSVLICPGIVAKGDGVSGFPIYANVSTESGVNVFGYVNRIS